MSEVDFDRAVLSAFENAQDRLVLLAFDAELERLVKDVTLLHMQFPPMSSYHRMLLYKVADSFHVDHACREFVDRDGIIRKFVVLMKKRESGIPDLRVSDLRSENSPADIPAMRIMTRENSTGSISLGGGRPEEIASQKKGGVVWDDDPWQVAGPIAGSSASHKDDSKSEPIALPRPAPLPRHSSSGSPSVDGRGATTTRTLEEREEEYARARARIFSSTDDLPDVPRLARVVPAAARRQSSSPSPPRSGSASPTFSRTDSSKESPPRQTISVVDRGPEPVDPNWEAVRKEALPNEERLSKKQRQKQRQKEKQQLKFGERQKQKMDLQRSIEAESVEDVLPSAYDYRFLTPDESGDIPRHVPGLVSSANQSKLFVPSAPDLRHANVDPGAVGNRVMFDYSMSGGAVPFSQSFGGSTNGNFNPDFGMYGKMRRDFE